MSKSSALYCAYTPETWQQVLALPRNEHKATLTENAEAVLELSDILSEIQSGFTLADHTDAAQLQAWNELVAILGFDVATGRKPKPEGLPKWLLELYPADRYAHGQANPERLQALSEAIRNTDLMSALEASAKAQNRSSSLKFYTLFQFLHACARQGRVLLAIESLG